MRAGAIHHRRPPPPARPRSRTIRRNRLPCLRLVISVVRGARSRLHNAYTGSGTPAENRSPLFVVVVCRQDLFGVTTEGTILYNIHSSIRTYVRHHDDVGGSLHVGRIHKICIVGIRLFCRSRYECLNKICSKIYIFVWKPTNFSHRVLRSTND